MDEITAYLQMKAGPSFQPEDPEWGSLMDSASVRTYKKNEVILKRGKRSEEVLLVAEGILASEFSVEDKTVIGRFFLPGALCSNFDSLLTQVPSRFQIVSVTTCQVISIPAVEFLRHYYRSNGPGVLFRKMILEIMAEDIWLTDMKLLYSKEEMVHQLREHYPDIIRLVPYKHIAMYLGITAEAYSRILKKSQHKT
ncbi:Crp/Fnr family transcriptional regulator [Chitinophaga sp. G-6-1-13]|uniref:Crp/Fnr family transcriptional regulator n=1 Tax=Chitinophaga fulva TaxID=2728842 RepID=A0A848GIS3_9BACT|nr:Crp/Fnr family transcriptional regulator [Chitinophaga fulva]NML38156.1 Crp/Fnr family transcriptional regulator [Chitinophaga fulva]